MSCYRSSILRRRTRKRNVADKKFLYILNVWSKIHRQTRGRTILLESLPGTSTVDSSLPTKRQGEDSSTESKRLKASFPMENGYVNVYTDGACENNGRSNARAGIGVWFDEGHPLNVSKPVQGRATNNHAEIKACTEALQVIKENGGDKAVIHTDSEFTIKCMTKWSNRWKQNNWKTAKGEPVKNREELQELDRTMSSFEDVKWVHVAGHNGIRGNEGADRLAREGASRYRPN